jgi:predicted aspartyl protease
MRFNGEWLSCDDGFVRPVIRGEVLKSDGGWWPTEFLVDTGADRTVFSADVLEILQLGSTPAHDRIGGVGGVVQSVLVQTQVRLTRDDGEKAVFRGEYAAFTSPEALDMSVMGRDFLDMFALVVDRRNGVVSLLGGKHQYSIQG